MALPRTRIGSPIVLQFLLIGAMGWIAYSQVVLPLNGIDQKLPNRWVQPYHFPVPTVEVTLDYPAVLKDPTVDPFRFPPLAGVVVNPGNGLEFLLPTRTRVSVTDPDPRQRLGVFGAPALRGLLAITVLALLLFMVRTLRTGDPFVPANARRIYAIAATVGIGGTLADLLGQWGRHSILDNPRIAPYVLPEGYHLPLLPLAIGLAIAVAAEVFRQGTSLRADVDGLV